MTPIIEVKNLSKKYRISRERDGVAYYSTLRDELANIIKKPFGFDSKKAGSKEDVWALKGASFSVQRGEALGIIGPNGAGKSTLLKILTRITPPTEGVAIVRGLVGSLLEVGTGFHTELTGRENIFLNGSILGMSKKEIERKFDQIVDFAGVRKFLDTPVKRFSSGMCVRLAFSVAAHLEPDILLIDEVLAVGDAAFQKKSFGKMEEVTKKDNRTILFVSHNMQAVKELCKRCVYLDAGEIKMIGPTEDVINFYLEGKLREAKQKFPINLRNLTRRGGGGKFKMTYLTLESENIVTGNDLIMAIGFEKDKDIVIDDMVVSVSFINSKGNNCFMLRSDVYKNRILVSGEKGKIKFTIPRLPLGEGYYSLQVKIFSLQGSQQGTHDWISSGIDFFVQAGNFYGTGHAGFPESASVFVDSKWETINE